MTPGDIDKLQKECDFEYMKEMIDKQQTQIRELTDKKNVVDLDYKEEYYKLQKENYKLKDKIEEILNNGEYIIIFEGDAEFPDEATCIDAQKYIKLEKLQELLESEE